MCVCECVCRVWDSLEKVWLSECAEVGVVVCVCVCLCAACGTVWSRFGGMSVQQVALWCVCVCVLCVGQFRQVWAIECAAGGFVVCVCACVLRMGQFGGGLGD